MDKWRRRADTKFVTGDNNLKFSEFFIYAHSLAIYATVSLWG